MNTHNAKNLRIKMRNPGNPNKFKSIEVFMIKKNAEAMALDIASAGHLLKAGDPAVQYIYEQTVKISGALHNLIEKEQAKEGKCKTTTA